MVKRQTVWLSTMMVLSLMLIGYYTMNGGTVNSPFGQSGSGPSAQTSVNPPGPASGAGTGSEGATPTSQNESSTQPTTVKPAAASPSDFFINYQTQVEQTIAKEEDMLTNVITNNNASTDQVSQAEQQLKKVENLDGGIQNARDAILGEGYKQCVIVPNPSSDLVTVYVQATHLTSLQAVQIMNIASQQLNVPINEVTVVSHA